MSEGRAGPPMDPHTSEADARQLQFAREQGEAYGRALRHMTDEVAHDGGQEQAGDYLVGYAVEEAEGMYEMVDGELVWHHPGDENVHLEVAVRDAGDGRFVPGVTVTATLIDPDGNEVGTHEQPLVWHPMIYHYGRNWTVPADGRYSLRVRLEPPTFMRHDEINGRRFLDPVEVLFDDVKVERGRT
jgi:Fe2+ transport protein